MEPEHAKVVMAHPAEDAWTPVELSWPYFDRIAWPKELATLSGAGTLPDRAARRAPVLGLGDVLLSQKR
ncbi:hypothetical protein ACWDKQ_10540 [Saccharopolyspora sp. NPDC000995]